MKKYVFLGACFVFLSASAPSWFLNPQSNPSVFFGLGSGADIRSAKQNAMADLTSSISSNIQTTFEKNTTRIDKTMASTTSKNIYIDAKMMNLANINVKHSECSDGKCYVQVEIQKSDLLIQLEQKIRLLKQEIQELSSPFSYSYKKIKLYPKLAENYILYSALGGNSEEMPKGIGEKPTFDLSFEYDGNFSNGFKGILEKTIQDSLTKYGKLSKASEWKVNVRVFQEDQSVSLDISTTYKDEVIHNASVYDTKKPSMSSSFFAKRLGVQAYKKMQKWGKN